jgi:hypothetical protein
MEKGTNGRYRKLNKGHVTVFPNDVQGLCTDTLALAWLKLNNPLYADIRISLASSKRPCTSFGKTVTCPFFNFR